jgi:hypothetical protein
MSEPIDPQKALRTIAAQAPLHAQAKANRVYMEEYRKTLKAQLMAQAAQEGSGSLGAQEVYAYAHPNYKAHLEAIREAVEADERFRWLQVTADARIRAWQTQAATRRAQERIV